jgi:hypothetical protein
MLRLRALHAAAVALTLAGVPLFAATTPSTSTPLGTVIAADRARVGDTGADVGTTVYGGDLLSTDVQGTVQIRAGAARLLLSSASTAVVNDTDGSPSAKLVQGTATFSTGNAQAFTLYASKAIIRPQSDVPSIGQVTYINAKELLVTARRGGIVVTVENDAQVIPEGQSYRVLLDPDAEPAQGPAGAGGQGGPTSRGGGPLKAGRSRFLIIAIGATAAAVGVLTYKALESPERP